MKKFSGIILIVFLFQISNELSAQSPMDLLSRYTGDWTASITMWMMPGDPPMTDEVKVHSEMMMNDLFLSSHYSGNVMQTKYEATNTIGYDLGKKSYVTSWIDNMNSGIQYLESSTNATGRSIEFLGKMFDPVSSKDIAVRKVYSFPDEKHQKIEVFSSVNGNEMKTLEISLSRK